MGEGLRLQVTEETTVLEHMNTDLMFKSVIFSCFVSSHSTFAL